MNKSEETLTHAELISRSWQEIKGRFAPFMLLACIAPAFSWLIAGLAFGLDPMTQSAAQQQHPLLMLLVSLLSALVGSYGTAALILFICKRTDTPWQALQTAWHPFLRLFGGGLLMSVGMSAALMLLGILLGGAVYLLGAPEVLYLFILLFLFLCAGVLMVYFCLLPYLLVLTDIPVLSCFFRRISFGKRTFLVYPGSCFWWA